MLPQDFGGGATFTGSPSSAALGDPPGKTTHLRVFAKGTGKPPCSPVPSFLPHKNNPVPAGQTIGRCRCRGAGGGLSSLFTSTGAPFRWERASCARHCP